MSGETVRIIPKKIAYTLDEAVEATGIGRSSFYEEAMAGRIQFRKRGRTTLILADELQRYLDALPPMEPTFFRREKGYKDSDNG